jgi:hypothetical protein
LRLRALSTPSIVEESWLTTNEPKVASALLERASVETSPLAVVRVEPGIELIWSVVPFSVSRSSRETVTTSTALFPGG